ncbi:DUF2087 domain-containing protein [uncultured Microbacterium sp.]|uniref:DUF2087 domain-containing protein n=1 Tax=uncultured Microbacterium sp. TaxID=191216 RepID=UPI0026180DF8|nr:DUF2087 domain-containing protein [uncultured Microbacterium sp.]
MTSNESERWRGVVAALLNDDLRAVLAETVPDAPLTPARRERAVARLEQLGLVRTEQDAVVFDSDAVRALLTPKPRPVGPERFLDREGRIDRYPLRDDDRRGLLEWVAERAFCPEDILTEADVNTRLEPYAPGGDVAVLRRYLVDHELLERTRSGSEYAPVPPTAAEPQ